MTRPTLVTGAAGFAGSHLVDLLVADGVSVVAWHRPGGSVRERPQVASAGVDLLDRAAVREALARLRPSVVYHCAGIADVGRSWERTEATFAVNVRGTHHVVESLREAAIEARVLIPGSATVYASMDRPIRESDPVGPVSPYALSKLAQELVGTTNPDGPPVFIARAFNHIGPRQDARFAASAFAQRIADAEAGRCPPEVPVGNLEARRDLTDVRDTVRAYRIIAESGEPGRAYNVCSGRATAIGSLLEMLLARARVRLTVKTDPARYRPVDVPLVLGDAHRIQRELGWKPEIPLERTLDDLLEYWRAR